jgi:hypothetical protein
MVAIGPDCDKVKAAQTVWRLVAKGRVFSGDSSILHAIAVNWMDAISRWAGIRT